MTGHREARLVTPTDLDEAQAAALEAFKATRGHAPFGPFGLLLHSPELQQRASAMGEYLRFRTGLPARLSELAILVVARAWDQTEEWAIHQPIALKSGLGHDLVDAIGRGERPRVMEGDEAAVFDFVGELIETRQVRDETYQRALAAFGSKGVLDLTGIAGYYSLLAMVLNVTLTQPSDGPALPPRTKVAAH